LVFRSTSLAPGFQKYPRAAAILRRFGLSETRSSIAGGHYLGNLALARSGVLPFFILASLVVFFWARLAYGALAAVIAVGFFTLTPVVLAFSSLAYTDLPAAATQLIALFEFARWLETRNTRSALGLGVALGLATLSKFTSLLFLPVACLAMVLCKLGLNQRVGSPKMLRVRWLAQIVMIATIAAGLVWSGYRFDIGRFNESMNLSPSAMPSFQHFPSPVAKLARTLVLNNPLVPAPELLSGIADSWLMNAEHSEAYLLGKERAGGWWYFFLLALLVKTPVPFLILAMLGLFYLFRSKQWIMIAPAAAACAILLVTMGVKHDAGLRHVLVVYPLLAIVSGHAGARLWKYKPLAAKLFVVLLLCWQAISSIRARHDYIAYFNEFAGNDPSHVLITGCDLDCGQDMLRLSSELAKKHISKISIAAWTTADLSRLGLPDFQVRQPAQPVTGWVAISLRSQRMGDAFHSSYGPEAFAWLLKYRPVEQIGSTIRLYYIPSDAANQTR